MCYLSYLFGIWSPFKSIRYFKVKPQIDLLQHFGVSKCNSEGTSEVPGARETECQFLLPLFTLLSFGLNVSEYSGHTLPLCSKSDPFFWCSLPWAHLPAWCTPPYRINDSHFWLNVSANENHQNLQRPPPNEPVEATALLFWRMRTWNRIA